MSQVQFLITLVFSFALLSRLAVVITLPSLLAAGIVLPLISIALLHIRIIPVRGALSVWSLVLVTLKVWVITVRGCLSVWPLVALNVRSVTWRGIAIWALILTPLEIWICPGITIVIRPLTLIVKTTTSLIRVVWPLRCVAASLVIVHAISLAGISRHIVKRAPVWWAL